MKRTKRLHVANARDKQEEVCSDLLIGLPEPAAQCIIQQLMQRGGRQLTELFRLCRTTRGMVLQHVRGAYYTPGRHGRHEGLHTLGAPTSLTVDLDGTDEEVFAKVLKDAAGKRSGRGWNINSLKLEVRVAVTACSACWEEHIAPCIHVNMAAWTHSYSHAASLVVQPADT